MDIRYAYRICRGQPYTAALTIIFAVRTTFSAESAEQPKERENDDACMCL